MSDFTTDAEDIQDAIDSLEYAISGKHQSSTGLCAKINHLPSPLFDKIHDYMEEWPLYSGRQTFPVPHPQVLPDVDNGCMVRLEAEWAYYNLPTYTGEYGELRCALGRYLINRLKEDLAEITS